MDDCKESVRNIAEQENITRIWAQRAHDLASLEQVETPDEQVTVVLIRLGKELFGLDVESVLEIRPKETITYVPRVPAWVLGVTNVRGRVLSVVDLFAFLGLRPGLPADDDGIEEFLIVVQNKEMELLLWSNRVVGVETLPVRHELYESVLHLLRREYVQAVAERKVGPTDQRHVTVINVSALLSDSRLIVHEG